MIRLPHYSPYLAEKEIEAQKIPQKAASIVFSIVTVGYLIYLYIRWSVEMVTKGGKYESKYKE